MNDQLCETCGNWAREGILLAPHHPDCPEAGPAAVEWLTALLRSPALVVTVEGGGIPEERFSLVQEEVMIVSRVEVSHLVDLLKRIPPETFPHAVPR